ncbi:MAG TPA: permease-like cell division protein FtsX [Lacibacter sp.]|nr:permease-like cell division protein FtsX [Lacibacter sp.]HMO87979.1 permease-like cell division protein FtsX [Lacibacter sp.]HMP86737.1 permease-like cell division protein FtsX [Lacibacter sp.]
MAQQQGKASMKRSKPSYIYTIIGVALVLFILGVLGWIFLNFQKVGTTLRENIQIHAWLTTGNQKKLDSLTAYISAQPYVKSWEYIDKEKAKAIYNKDGNESWDKILNENPLPESIDFFAKADFVQKDSLERIAADLLARFPGVISEVQYPADLVVTITDRARKFGIALLIIAILLSAVVIVSIDSTIRLAMFSNRFLIKTMQMVGATRGFIARPMNIRALINGLISSGVAITAIWAVILWMESYIPDMVALRDVKNYVVLFGSIIVIGVGISVYSTHRSVMKYLKMKLDELY